MLEGVCHLRPIYPPREGPQDTPFTRTVRNKFVRRVPASLKNSVIAFLCQPNLIVRIAVTEFRNFNAIGVIGSCSGRNQVVALKHQRPGGCAYYNGQQSQSSIQNSLTHASLWDWLLDHSVPRIEKGKKHINFFSLSV